MKLFSAEGQPTPQTERIPTYDIGSNFIDEYHPSLIGRGGEHLVFSLEGKPDIVAKVDLASIDRFYGKSLDGQNPLKGYMHRAKAFMEERRQLRMGLKQAFGVEHVLSQKMFFAKVPFTPEMRFELRHLQERTVGIAPASVWSLVEIQKRSKLIGKPDVESVTGGYAEWSADTLPVELYASLTQSLLNGEPVSKQDFKQVQGRQMLNLLERVDQEKEWEECLREFVQGAITFTKNTQGTCIDLAGGENVVIGKPDAGSPVTFEVIDPLPTTTCTIEMVQEAWRKYLLKQPISGPEQNRILNGMNYLRTINGLASYVDAPERLSFLPEGASIDIEQGKRLINLYQSS